MKIKTTWIVLAILAVASLVIGLAVYGLLPAQVASHWNAQGEADWIQLIIIRHTSSACYFGGRRFVDDGHTGD